MDHPVCLKLEETVSRPVDFQKRIIVVLEATFDVEAECTHFRQYLADHNAFVFLLRYDHTCLPFGYDGTLADIHAVLELNTVLRPWVVSGRDVTNLPYIARQPHAYRQRFLSGSEGAFVVGNCGTQGPSEIITPSPARYALVAVHWVYTLVGMHHDWPEPPTNHFLVDTRPFTSEEMRMEDYAFALIEHLEQWGPQGTKNYMDLPDWHPVKKTGRKTGPKALIRLLPRIRERHWPNENRVWRERRDVIYSYHPWLRKAVREREKLKWQ